VPHRLIGRKLFNREDTKITKKDKILALRAFVLFVIFVPSW